MNKLAAELKEAKAQNKWTLRYMADVVGTVAPTVLSWTRETRPEPEFWPGIAKLLGWSPDQVQEALGLGNGGAKASPSPSAEEEHARVRTSSREGTWR